jgi:HPt (histidine-containing phosphotransfer) domain-containing protein
MNRHYSIDSLKEMAGDDRDFMAIVAKTFLDEIPPDLKAMGEAIKNNNRELAYQFAHKMKPNLEMFGIDVVKDITTIENWTRTLKNVSSISSNVEHVTSTVEKVLEELKEDFNL